MGFIEKFFEGIKKNQRARNEKALETDPELKRLEEKLAKSLEASAEGHERWKKSIGFIYRKKIHK